MSKKFDWDAAIRRFISRNYSPDKALALTRQLNKPLPRPPEADFLIDAISELLEAYENQRSHVPRFHVGQNQKLEYLRT